MGEKILSFGHSHHLGESPLGVICVHFEFCGICCHLFIFLALDERVPIQLTQVSIVSSPIHRLYIKSSKRINLTLIHLTLYRYSYQLTCVPLPSAQCEYQSQMVLRPPLPPLRSGQMSRVLLFSDPCVRYEGEGGGGHIHKLYIIAY